MRREREKLEMARFGVVIIVGSYVIDGEKDRNDERSGSHKRQRQEDLSELEARPGLHREFQDSQNYIKRTYLEKKECGWVSYSYFGGQLEAGS